MARILIGTKNGLRELGGASPRELDGRAVNALAVRDGGVWAVVDDEAVLRARNGTWEEVARLDRLRARCVLPAGDRLVVGTSEAHLVDAATGAPVESFDRIETRDKWYTPWGGPPDVRSLALDPSGGWWVNVHVGGVWHSPDRGGSWRETVEVDADTHQVQADAASATVAVAAAIGYGQSRDGGRTWSWTTDGLHATYCRAVAFAGSTVLVTASTGPFTEQAAVYRRPLDSDGPFERCRDGLPEWFGSNIDTGCLAAAGSTVVLGTADGELYGSQDEGRSWELLAGDLPPARAVALV